MRSRRSRCLSRGTRLCRRAGRPEHGRGLAPLVGKAQPRATRARPLLAGLARSTSRSAGRARRLEA
ncbi:MAG: hypothetical protein E6G45_11590 [Actinobacteria bacterium]|nr:MAG: hypothetical protein E6G45_11590 [Actinomycetota bacterium]